MYCKPVDTLLQTVHRLGLSSDLRLGGSYTFILGSAVVKQCTGAPTPILTPIWTQDPHPNLNRFAQEHLPQYQPVHKTLYPNRNPTIKSMHNNAYPNPNRLAQEAVHYLNRFAQESVHQSQPVFTGALTPTVIYMIGGGALLFSENCDFFNSKPFSTKQKSHKTPFWWGPRPSYWAQQ